MPSCLQGQQDSDLQHWVNILMITMTVVVIQHFSAQDKLGVCRTSLVSPLSRHGKQQQDADLCTAAGSSGMVPPPPHSNLKMPHCSTATSVLLADVAPAGMQHHYGYLYR